MAQVSKTVGGGFSMSGSAIVGQCLRIANGTTDLENSPYGSVEVALTSAQILALSTTPVELVPAPGTGKVLQYLGMTVISDYGGTQYANGAVLIVKYTDASGIAASADVLAATLTAANDVVTTNIPITAVAAANAALVLTTATPFITGTGVLRLKVLYAVHTTGL